MSPQRETLPDRIRRTSLRRLADEGSAGAEEFLAQGDHPAAAAAAALFALSAQPATQKKGEVTK